jgi:uncharacterized membrane protein YqjE
VAGSDPLSGGHAVQPAHARDDRPAYADESFGTLLKELAQDTSTLVKQEIALARAELGEKARIAGTGAGMLAGAGVVALLALGALTALLIIALDIVVDLWVAALLVTLLWAVVALILALAGRSQLRKAAPPTPQQTIETVKEDLQWAKHPTRSART